MGLPAVATGSNLAAPNMQDPVETRRRDPTRRGWRDYEWAILSGLVVLAVALGVIGIGIHARATGMEWSFLERVYRALLLFTLEGGTVEDSAQMNPALEAARFLAPALTLYAAALAVMSLFSEQWTRLKVRFCFRRHIVICGMGGIGYRLACRWREVGTRVVVIEKDADNDRIAPARARRILVMIGDAQDPLMLQRARVGTASQVVVAGGDDGTNIEIAMALRSAVTGPREEPVACTVHLLDARACELLGERELRHPEGETVRLHFYNVYQRAAQALLKTCPLFGPDAASEPLVRPPNVLVVGLGRMGQSFVGELARRWHRRHQGRPPFRLPVTVLDREASVRLAALHARHPALATLCDLCPLDLDLTSAAGERGDFLRPVPEAPDRSAFTHAYIFFADDARSLSAALLLQRLLRARFGAAGDEVRITVRTWYHKGLGKLLLEQEGALAALQPFGLFESVCEPDRLPCDTGELLARAFHRDFRASEAAAREKNPLRPRKPTDRPWEELDEDTRRSNRARADALEKQLAALDLGLRPRLDWTADYFVFRPEEIEYLARAEHERWCAERRRHGWRHGPRRDDPNKLHPDLVEWPDLSEPSQNFNRVTSRKIPLLLAEYDFEVYRLKARPGPTETPHPPISPAIPPAQDPSAPSQTGNRDLQAPRP
jgi:hypothetical protein